MKVHLKQIPSQGLHLSGEEDCPIQELASEEIRCAGPLHYDIDVGVADGGLWANGSLSQPVELRCVSCLQKFVHEIRVPAFAVHTELHGPRRRPDTFHARGPVAELTGTSALRQRR
jgi:hypothetical protein